MVEQHLHGAIDLISGAQWCSRAHVHDDVRAIPLARKDIEDVNEDGAIAHLVASELDGSTCGDLRACGVQCLRNLVVIGRTDDAIDEFRFARRLDGASNQRPAGDLS